MFFHSFLFIYILIHEQCAFLVFEREEVVNNILYIYNSCILYYIYIQIDQEKKVEFIIRSVKHVEIK